MLIYVIRKLQLKRNEDACKLAVEIEGIPWFRNLSFVLTFHNENDSEFCNLSPNSNWQVANQ
jgi:hypothetical protein